MQTRWAYSWQPEARVSICSNFSSLTVSNLNSAEGDWRISNPSRGRYSAERHTNNFDELSNRKGAILSPAIPFLCSPNTSSKCRICSEPLIFISEKPSLIPHSSQHQYSDNEDGLHELLNRQTLSISWFENSDLAATALKSGLRVG